MAYPVRFVTAPYVSIYSKVQKYVDSSSVNNDPTAAGEDCILASLERPSNYRLYYNYLYTLELARLGNLASEAGGPKSSVFTYFRALLYCRICINFCGISYNLCELVLRGRSQTDSLDKFLQWTIYAGDDIGSFPNLSPVSLHGEIVQPSSASYTPVLYNKECRRFFR